MISLNNKTAILHHRMLIQKKSFLKLLYIDFYQRIKKQLPHKGHFIELGSGGGCIKQVIPNIITSEVVKISGIDKRINAEKLPFASCSISAFILLNVFHHIKHPEKALQEMDRTLKSGGKIIMIEPWNTPWSRLIYRHFHHEDFDPNTEWIIRKKGRMTGANSALPWIIFERDKNIVKQKFPRLHVASIALHTPFSYILSGGLSFPQILPTFLCTKIKQIENKLPQHKWAMFATICICKK